MDPSAFEYQSMIAAIESGESWPIAGVVLLFALAVFRSGVEPRLGTKTRELTSMLSGGLAVMGTAWALGTIWWHGVIACFGGFLLSAGFYALLFKRLLPSGLGGLLGLLAALGAILALGGCDPEDRGLMIIRGVETHAAAYPVPVSAEPEVLEETLDAVDWLNGQASAPRPCEFGAGICVATIIWAELVDEGLGVVHVMDGTTAPDSGGYTTVEIAESGAILAADVVVQVGYSEPHHLRHELGHGVLGLDDDPESVDLGSIMSSPNTPPDGEVTDHDWAEAQRAWDWTL